MMKAGASGSGVQTAAYSGEVSHKLPSLVWEAQAPLAMLGTNQALSLGQGRAGSPAPDNDASASPTQAGAPAPVAPC